MQCPLCGTRKARRTCPALGRQICSVCCGTKRLTEIRCPADCVYLTSAREHPPAVVQRQQQQDLGVLLPAMHGLSETQARIFFLAVSIVARFKPDDLQRVLDADIADAAGSLAATFETSQRGVIYEHRATSLVAQRLTSEMKTVLAQVGEKAGSWFERDAAAALRALERGVRAKREHDPENAFLELLKRVAGPSVDGEPVEQKGAASNLIIPGSGI
jgi:hypothetical protein